MSQPPIPRFGKFKLICHCGETKNVHGIENHLDPEKQKCPKCGSKMSSSFTPFDPDEDVDAT